jgi:hypothetical protein
MADAGFSCTDRQQDLQPGRLADGTQESRKLDGCSGVHIQKPEYILFETRLIHNDICHQLNG